MTHKPNDITTGQVKALASCGIRMDDIAKYIGVSKKTLLKHYESVIHTSKIERNAFVGSTLFQKVKDGNMTAILFWLKCQAGWKEADKTRVKEEDEADSEELGQISKIEVTLAKPDSK